MSSGSAFEKTTKKCAACRTISRHIQKITSEKSSLSINRLNDLVSEIDLRISVFENGTYAGYGMSNNDSKAILDKHTAE